MSSMKLIGAMAVTMLLVACGGGGGSGSSAPTGTATLTMSDAPVDGYSKIIMVVSQIRFLSDGGQDVLVLDEPKSIDFLALSNFSEVLAKREVVIGTYSKIRLILDSLTLVQTDTSGNDTFTDVPLHGLQKIDINPQGPFQVHAGEEIVIHVDLDLNRSIHIVQAGNSNKVNFRPVIFATIATQPVDKLFRVEGTIDSIDGTAGTLTVCDIRHVSDDGAAMPDPMEICVFTAPDSQTSYFDIDATPDSAGFGGLAVNDPVVMYGKFTPGATPDTLVPAVIARGSRETFVRERGISSAFDTTSETMNLDEVSGVCLLSPPQREVSVVAETAVFLDDGTGKEKRALDRTAIQSCHATEAEGAAVTTPTSFLRSFVLIQGEPAATGEEVDGTLSFVNSSHYTLAPALPGPDQCVITSSSTVITQISLLNNVPTVSHPTTVPTGVSDVAVFGVRDLNNCLVASAIVNDETSP